MENNIHILQTDKPSRLVRIYSNVERSNFAIKLGTEVNDPFKEYVNIYITSDEEIKEGDYILCEEKIGKVKKVLKKDKYPYLIEDGWRLSRSESEKIILTTDQDLDGVQAIDDEFLEWFVKNPSCEKVEVLRCPIEGLYTIIPKEEPTIVRFPTYYESKQETLEEVAEIWVHNRFTKQIKDEDIYASESSIVQSHILFAKWQQKNSYSEEDMEIVEISSIDANYIPHYQTKEGQLLATKFNVKQFKKK